MILYNKIIFYLVLNAVALIRKKRVIGGQTADINEFPYQVSIRLIDKNRHYCSGAIITEKLILSAAHCFFLKDAYIPKTRIFTGTSSSSEITQNVYKIKQIHIHPKFTGEKSMKSMYQYDLAMIEVNGSIKFNEVVKPANLPNENVSSGDEVFVSGWGLTSYPNGKIAKKLQKIKAKIMSNTECAKKNPIKFYGGQYCTLQKKGVGFCSYDSGGPLSRKGNVVGIVSFNIPCATIIPDVYTNVYYFLDYIRSIMK